MYSYVEIYPCWWLLYMCLSVLGTFPCKLPDKVCHAFFFCQEIDLPMEYNRQDSVGNIYIGGNLIHMNMEV